MLPRSPLPFRSRYMATKRGALLNNHLPTFSTSTVRHSNLQQTNALTTNQGTGRSDSDKKSVGTFIHPKDLSSSPTVQDSECIQELHQPVLLTSPSSARRSPVLSQSSACRPVHANAKTQKTRTPPPSSPELVGGLCWWGCWGCWGCRGRGGRRPGPAR